MALPIPYNAATLAAYMRDTLGATGKVLALDDVAKFTEQVTDITLALGVADLGDVTNIRLLRAMARRAAWQRAMDETSGDFSFSTFGSSGGSNSRSQIFDHCKTQRDEADTLVTSLTPTTTATGRAKVWSGAVRVETGW